MAKPIILSQPGKNILGIFDEDQAAVGVSKTGGNTVTV